MEPLATSLLIASDEVSITKTGPNANATQW